jgi:DNA-binding NtrC family response regulator
MSQFKIFIIEDDPFYGELLKYHLSLNPDYEITLYNSAKQCLDNLYKNPAVICMDFGLPDMTGDKLLSSIKSINNSIPVVVISGQDKISVAVNLVKAGASDYIIKDDNTKELLWNAILKVRENAALRQEVEVLKDQLEQKFSFEKSSVKVQPLRKRLPLLKKPPKQTSTYPLPVKRVLVKKL